MNDAILPQIRTPNALLFPEPEDGERLELTPPTEIRTWLQYALDVYGSFFPHFGGRDGGWAQGTFYGSSYVKWYLPFFFRPDLILVYDDLKAQTDVACAWLAHTLSPPQKEGDRIVVRRDLAALDIRLFSAGPLTYNWTDQFSVDPNAGVPEHLHRHQPAQYHLTWTAEKSAERRFAAVLSVNGKPVETACKAETLTIETNGIQVQVPLAPNAPDEVTCNNRKLLTGSKSPSS